MQAEEGSDLHPAWWLLLPHPAMCCEQVACRLLCVSKVLSTAIINYCRGLLACKLVLGLEMGDGYVVEGAGAASSSSRRSGAAYTARQFTAWLAKYGSMLQSLDLQVSDELLPAAAVAEALRQAAAAEDASIPGAAGRGVAGTSSTTDVAPEPAPSGLRLQHFRGSLHPEILQLLPSRHMTSLVLIWDPLEHLSDWDTALAARASLTHLTGLQRLIMFEDQDSNADMLAAALSGMSQLTFVEAGITRGEDSGLLCLPNGLKELTIGAMGGAFYEYDEEKDEVVGDFHLGHLTAMTRLCLMRNCKEELRETDVLPPNVEELILAKAHGIAPLLQLQQLRMLAMHHACLPADQLQQLTGLRALQELQLEYWGGPYNVPQLHLANRAAAAWEHLPLRSLEFGAGISLAKSTVQQLGQLSSLTKLHVEHIHSCEANKREVAAALSQLTGLRKLHLDVRTIENAPEDEWILGGVANGNKAILQAVGGMQYLVSLKLGRLPFTKAATAHLTGLMHLTQLKALCCDLSDYDVIVITSHLTGLRRLDITGSINVTDTVMPAIAKQLLELQMLVVQHVNVSDMGVKWLSSLQRLKQLGLCGTAVSAAEQAAAEQRGCSMMRCPYC